MRTPVGYRFWLSRTGQGDLIRGGGPAPDLRTAGFKLTAGGLAFLVRDETGLWTGRYLVSYDRFLRDNAWFLAGAGFLIVLCLLGGVGYARWYRYDVVEPARKAQQEILEREAFNRTLIETAPVALCLLEMAEGRVAFGNASALAWLGFETGRCVSLRDCPGCGTFGSRPAAASPPAFSRWPCRATGIC